jgi:hypothetical protein
MRDTSLISEKAGTVGVVKFSTIEFNVLLEFDVGGSYETEVAA